MFDVMKTFTIPEVYRVRIAKQTTEMSVCKLQNQLLLLSPEGTVELGSSGLSCLEGQAQSNVAVLLLNDRSTYHSAFSCLIRSFNQWEHEV